MAAGKGSRMRSNLPKPLVPLAGKPLVKHLLESISDAGIANKVVVVGHDAQRMRSALGPGVTTALQSVLSGTATAVEAAQDATGTATEIMVTVGDSPLLSPASISRLLKVHRETDAACSFLTAHFGQHYPYGRVLRGADGKVVGCVEERSATPQQSKIREYLSSHYVFRAESLWNFLPRIAAHPESQERYLTDIITLLVQAGERVEAVVIDDWRELVGLNTPEDLAWATEVLNGR